MDAACEILRTARRIAVLGMSPKSWRTSHEIAKYLVKAGFEVVPVNPGYAAIEGLRCYETLADLDKPVDIVDVFRAAEHEKDVCQDILAMAVPPKAVWFQLNAGGYGVEDTLRAEGIEVFVDSCIKVVHSLCMNR